MQEIKERLEDLNITQLQMLIQHINFGKDHLKSLLTENQLEDLFKWVKLKEDQKRTIETTKLEQLGNMSLVINTILTSTFGAWMGLSSCIGCGLGSYQVLTMISVLAFFLSGCIGYISSNKTKEQALQSIEKQRLLNFQSDVLQVLNDQIGKKIEGQIYYLNSALFILKRIKNEYAKTDFSFTSFSETSSWFEQLETTLKNRLQEIEGQVAYEFYQKKIVQGCYIIKKALNKHIKFIENLSSHTKINQRQLKLRPVLSFLKILTNPAYAKPQHRFNENNRWSTQDFKDLFLGLIPTIWGGFASMFVFVGGVPNIAKELGYTDIFEFLTDPTARLIEIALALLITAYFGFSFLYSSKKQWQRERVMKNTSNKITESENNLLVSRHKLTTLYAIKNSIQKLISIFSVIKLTDHTNEND